MSDKINPGFLKRICKLSNYLRILLEDLHMKKWLQIIIEDLWVIISIANSCWASAYEQVNYRSQAKIYEWLDQLRILVKDLHVKKLTADLSIKSMSEQIIRGYLLKNCMWAELIRVLIDKKAVTQIWLQWCISYYSCSNVDPRRTRATVALDVDPLYMESPDVWGK